MAEQKAPHLRRRQLPDTAYPAPFAEHLRDEPQGLQVGFQHCESYLELQLPTREARRFPLVAEGRPDSRPDPREVKRAVQTKQAPGEEFDGEQDTISFNEFQPLKRMSAERGGMAMTHDGVGHVQTFPSGYSSAQTKLGVVGVGEEVLVETTDLVKHRPAIHGGATVRPDDFLETIVLSAVDLPSAASTVLSIEVDKVSHFIDACRVFV